MGIDSMIQAGRHLLGAPQLGTIEMYVAEPWKPVHAECKGSLLLKCLAQSPSLKRVQAEFSGLFQR